VACHVLSNGYRPEMARSNKIGILVWTPALCEVVYIRHSHISLKFWEIRCNSVTDFPRVPPPRLWRRCSCRSNIEFTCIDIHLTLNSANSLAEDDSKSITAFKAH
jgi:hypothetical protein